MDRGHEAVIADGLKAGETVVTDGQLRLTPGAKVSTKGGGARKGLMNLSALFIKRPVATTLIQLSIVIFGVIGYRALPVSDLPSVDFPTISVNAALPGANPETMASAVATPLEKQFATISGISSISSTNSLGSTYITLQFDLDRDIDAAAQDVQGAISRTTRQLPPDMPAPPSLQKVNPADAPILFLTLSSQTLPLSDINEYAEINIAQRISMLKGVAQVGIFGAQKFAVRIDVDPRQLAARNLDIDQVATAVSRGSVNRPTGTLFGPDRTFAVKADGQLTNAAGVPAARRRLPRRPADPARRGRQRLRRRRERQDGELVQRLAHDLPRRQPAARHQHGRDRRLDSRACCRRSRRSCPPRCRWRSAATDRSRFASRSTTSSSRWS